MPPSNQPCDNMEVKLRFLLESRRASEEQVEAISEGDRFVLNCDPNQAVVMNINGVPVARGTICRVGDHLAVRVSAWETE